MNEQKIVSNKGTARIPYSEATNIIRELKSRIRFCPVNDKYIRFKIIVAGSYRRKKSTLKDIDLLIVFPKRYDKIKQNILKSIVLLDRKSSQIQSMTVNPKMHGSFHSSFNIKLFEHPEIKLNADLFLIPEESLPFALFHYTGDKTFNIRTRAYVKKLGMLLNQYGLFDAKSGKKIKTGIKTERDIFKYLGITYKSPSQRSENV